MRGFEGTVFPPSEVAELSSAPPSARSPTALDLESDVVSASGGLLLLLR